MEHYIYRSLMDWMYLNEKPIPKETQRVLRWLGLGIEEEPSLLNVYSDFFIERDDGYIQARVFFEINEYHQKADISRKNGKKGGRPKKQQLTEDKKPRKTHQVNSQNLNKPASKVTNNQEPITNNQDKHICAFSDFWNLYPVKKQKKTAQGIWQRKKLNDKAEEIITALQNQIANDSQWSAGYVPNPTTYLNQERWTDEISRGSHSSQQTKSEQSKQALRDWVNQD
jgi:uncharacterized protein YdaU (DUF1376 family)